MALIPVLSMSRGAPVLGRYGMVTLRSLWRRQSVLKSGTGQSSLASLRRLATSPVAWRNGSPNSARHASGTPGSPHPRGSPGARAGHSGPLSTLSGSNQISRDPRGFSPALQARQLVVR
jgi:hypothetical protein